MSDYDENKEQRVGLWLAGSAAALTVLATLFYSIWSTQLGYLDDTEQTMATETVTASEAAPAEASAAVSPADVILATDTQQSDGDAKVIVENGIVKFYFASGKADLAAGVDEALQDVLAGVKEGRKAVISGFHDTTGKQTQNEELSKQRAFAVRDALLGFGVPEAQIELRKPENAEGSGNNKAEARRVEVVLE